MRCDTTSPLLAGDGFDDCIDERPAYYASANNQNGIGEVGPCQALGALGRCDSSPPPNAARATATDSKEEQKSATTAGPCRALGARERCDTLSPLLEQTSATAPTDTETAQNDTVEVGPRHALGAPRRCEFSPPVYEAGIEFGISLVQKKVKLKPREKKRPWGSKAKGRIESVERPPRSRSEGYPEDTPVFNEALPIWAAGAYRA